MNDDQPEPATVCEGCGGDRFIETKHTRVCKRCGLTQPNPATGDALADHVAGIQALRSRIEELEKQLAAEREQSKRDWTPGFVAAYKRLEKELAAEREKVREKEEELNEAVKLLKVEDIDAAIAKLENK